MTETLEKSPPPSQPSSGGPWKRFFTNQTRFDFIGRSRLWLIVSLVVVTVCLAGVAIRGFNFGIDFTGGAAYTVADAPRQIDPDVLRSEIGAIVEEDLTVQVVEGGTGAIVSTQALADDRESRARIVETLAEVTGAAPREIDVSVVGPRWGAQISEQMLRALLVFLVLVVGYITLRFEWRMALAALVTLIHDVIVTVGVYAIVGFHVSPASVIALLTILGYSLYDTVVVFDRVTDESKSVNATSTETYGEMANRAVNEVLLRSLSTSITSLLPVGSLLFIGANLLGADTLSDLALALFVGMAVGTYSSVFVATPMLVFLKEREPRYAELKEKILARRGGEQAAAIAGGGGAAARSPKKAHRGKKPRSRRSG
ncbi:MAG TPA: protein translocase subunit SecF [Egibacteraceae bacterium]|nr:protein translocase subunit SecF [Egibacteraceae bacterium]